jgi:hypothetical protein
MRQNHLYTGNRKQQEIPLVNVWLSLRALSYETTCLATWRQTMGDFWDVWWQQTYQVKSIVLGNVLMLRTKKTIDLIANTNAQAQTVE